MKRSEKTAPSWPIRSLRLASHPDGAEDAKECERDAKGAWSVIIDYKRFLADDSGQDLIEYSLLAGLISLVAVTVIINVGTGVNGVWIGIDGTVGSIPTP